MSNSKTSTRSPKTGDRLTRSLQPSLALDTNVNAQRTRSGGIQAPSSTPGLSLPVGLGDNSPKTAQSLPVGTSPTAPAGGAKVVENVVSKRDRKDFYSFDVTTPSLVSLRLESYPGFDVKSSIMDVVLSRQQTNGSLKVVKETKGVGNLVYNPDTGSSSFLSGVDLGRVNSGKYFVQVKPTKAYQNSDIDRELPYNLEISTAPITTSKRFNIEFDYRFDKQGFFSDPKRRKTLEAAAQLWESYIDDDFTNIPSGTEFRVTNPETKKREVVRLTKPIDDLKIFVGARSNPRGDSLLAFGKPDGLNAQGTIYRNRTRFSKFEPWAGSIAFNSAITSWHFDSTPSLLNVPLGQADFFSVAVHQIGHVLGIGTSPIFKLKATGRTFNGLNAKVVNNGQGIPISEDGRHIRQGFLSNGQTVLMNSARRVRRIMPTAADRAILADIGYAVPALEPQGEVPDITTIADDQVFGTVLPDVLDGLAGNDYIDGGRGKDQLTGNSGDDVLLGGNAADQLFGGEGNDTLKGDRGDDLIYGGTGNDTLEGGQGKDQFIFEANSGIDIIRNFNVKDDKIVLRTAVGGTPLTYQIAQTIKQATGGFTSEVWVGAGGDRITVLHDLPLQAKNFSIA
jgi:hypothetical protein